MLGFLARVIDHIPEPSQQMVRYWGFYANAGRGKRRKAAPGRDIAQAPHGQDDDGLTPREPGTRAPAAGLKRPIVHLNRTKPNSGAVLVTAGLAYLALDGIHLLGWSNPRAWAMLFPLAGAWLAGAWPRLGQSTR